MLALGAATGKFNDLNKDNAILLLGTLQPTNFLFLDKIEDILPLIEYGHHEFGENKVQEAQAKWTKIKENHKDLKLHMLGKLQTNKVKNAVEKLYGVQVNKVRTINYGGGKPSTKYTNKGIVEQLNKKWKKAIVTVAEGETIDLFNNV